MKNILIATVAAVGLAAGAAQAADMRMPMKAPMAPAPVYSWTGCYIDAGGGAGMWNQSHYTFGNATGAVLTGEQTTGGRGWYGEVGGGCDYQFSMGNMGNFVVGILGGYDFMSLKGAYTDSLFVTATGYEKETGSGFVGGRLGYLVTPNLLTYTSGGWTEARFNAFTATGPIAASYSLNAHTYNGYFLGGGMEYSLAGWLGLPQGIFLRSDYRWSTYKQADLPYLNLAGTPFPGGAGDSTHVNKYVQQIGTELIWRFNYH
jgi:outer membrane immunogenic protein